MKDIVSNALIRGLGTPESDVKSFLEAAETRFSSGAELASAAAARFGVLEEELMKQVVRFKHCNCNHAEVFEDGSYVSGEKQATGTSVSTQVSKFAQDVTLHVVLHEMGHALIREFDLPVLGNEETIADAFATHFLTHYLPERAPEVLDARVRSLMSEAHEVPRREWTVRGEHNNDARRAFQIAALAIAADHNKYRPLAELVGMSPKEVSKSRDYGAEIHRSWRRTLRPLWMPQGVPSTEARVKFDAQSGIAAQLHANGLIQELESILSRFDWHSQVTIHFNDNGDGAGWSRSKRTIHVSSNYVRRFIKQGSQVDAYNEASATDE